MSKKDELSEAKRHALPGAAIGAGAAYGLKKKILKSGLAGALAGGALGYYKGSTDKSKSDRDIEKSASDMGCKIARLLNGLTD
jgi:phage-related minor tail protein